MNTYLNKLSLYNDWANHLLLEHFKLHEKEIPATSLRFLSHIFNTQSIWLSRIKGEQACVSTWDVHELFTGKEMHEQSSAGLKTFHTVGSDSSRIIVYYNTKGLKFETSLNDILIHVYNHGTYHRAQIAQDMRINGLEPINTDYITFVR